jgi:hypothetical protein
VGTLAKKKKKKKLMQALYNLINKETQQALTIVCNYKTKKLIHQGNKQSVKSLSLGRLVQEKKKHA